MSRTLIVEDNNNFRQTLANLIHTHCPEMVLEEAKDGKEALQKFRSSRPDIIFMDVKLPGENGLEITKKMRAFDSDVNIIILTNHDLPEYREAARKYGANYFLSKNSSSAEDILSMIKSIIDALPKTDGWSKR